jgi:hypothetical protein
MVALWYIRVYNDDVGQRKWPRRWLHTPEPGPQKGLETVDAKESSAPHAHSPTDDHDDTAETHYACLERPCACIDGWVFVGYIDEYGEEREASYRCRRCAASR